MAKNFEISLLLGYYGALLSDRQRGIAESYYFDDLSLSEIAENTGITRQGVLDNIRHAEQKLEKFEDALKFASKMTEISDLSEEIVKIAKTSADRKKLEEIGKRLNDISGE